MNCSRHDLRNENSASLSRANHGLIEAVIRFAGASPYKMTHRFLAGTRTWESWYYRKFPGVKADHCFQVKCALRALHRLHVDGIEVPKTNWHQVYYQTRLVCKMIANAARGVYPEFGTMPSKKRVCRKSPKTGLSPRSVARAEAYQARREAGWVPPKYTLKRRGAVRKPSSEGPAYVPPNKRKLVPGQTCPKCRVKVFRDYAPQKTKIRGYGPTGDDYTLHPKLSKLDRNSYYHCWMAVESGLWTGDDIRNYFAKSAVQDSTTNPLIHHTDVGSVYGLATAHRVRRAQHRYDECHPPRCGCTASIKRSAAKGLKLSLP
jgi:hypothetical protein